MTTERDRHELHAEQKRDVPLSLRAQEGKDSHYGVYLHRPAVAATVLPFTRSQAGWRNSPTEPPRAA